MVLLWQNHEEAQASTAFAHARSKRSRRLWPPRKRYLADKPASWHKLAFLGKPPLPGFGLQVNNYII
ncbi:hypothetical protein GMO_09350 [Gluconobacter morbifer G707]|uniref:Uncharacterized protein n=1 Tax=Gluconobacter morbifer G707 TaxID=1088869 RepID=G6XHG9_9PROT|nr:hypothetical protein GMO_09350 [Gluconobacter morbifer G707]